MVDCKICENPYCEHAGTQRGIVVSCNGYIEPKKPQTNADRIRAMSDEELAKMIDAFNAYFGMCNRDEIELLCTDCELHDLCCLGEGDALGWLRQPVKEDEQ